MKIISWNVNGIRALCKKGLFLPFIEEHQPDVLCLQEVRAEKEDIPDECLNLEGYNFFLSTSKVKKGYSGVAILSKHTHKEISYGFGVKKFDDEGRIIKAEFGDFVLFNIYFPNGKQNQARLDYKMEFYEYFATLAKKITDNKQNLIVCGDFNTAHTELDLANPKENENVSGFLKIERDWISSFIKKGFLDTFRLFNEEGKNYTWWSYRTRARARNSGWRLDYFFVNAQFKNKIEKAYILKDVLGSDHCPVGIDININKK